MRDEVPLTPVHEIQGDGPFSPLAGRRVRIRGVVTGAVRRAFFVQDPTGGGHPARSDAICVFRPGAKPPRGALVEVEGKIVDFRREEIDRPTTQLVADRIEALAAEGPVIEPVWLRSELIESELPTLARRLEALESMLVGVEAKAIFLAPSNPFGDYVVLPPDSPRPRTRHGGVRIDPDRPLRWYPGFRLLDYRRAPRVDVGAVLLDPVVGPLHYRVGSFQIAAVRVPRVRPARVRPTRLSLAADASHLTVMTLNGFNLDPRIERPERVDDPRRDIDDDVGDGRYDALARALVEEAGSPDVVALQEMQDDDGAEVSPNVSARRNYRTLLQAIRRAGGPRYRWVDRPPERDADGGQPGGNIRNAFLYDPGRVEIEEAFVRRLGVDDPAFEESRKPLVARFRFRPTGRSIEIFNVHLASKRHQHSIFAVADPGLDPREEIRIAQAQAIAAELDRLGKEGVPFYVTGDFNDFEFSPTVRALCGGTRVDLVERVPEGDRYDYNHRGVLQALMHGIVPRSLADHSGTGYEILHGNELVGARPGHLGERPTDHAYVVARLAMEG